MNKYDIQTVIRDKEEQIEISLQSVNAINIQTVLKMLPVILEVELEEYPDQEFEINIKLMG